MLAVRNAQRKARGEKQQAVVAREKVAVLSIGTLTDAEMVAHRPDAAYVLAGAAWGGGGCNAGRAKGSAGCEESYWTEGRGGDQHYASL